MNARSTRRRTRPAPAVVVCVTMIAATLTLQPAGAQVFVEDSPAALDLLLSAEDRLGNGEPEEAAKLIQKLLDEHGTKLLELEPGRYSEARRVVGHRLLEQPILLTAYRQLYEPLAAELLEQAGHDRAVLAQILHRYGLTDSGLNAALRLAGIDLEAAEADAASVVLTQLADHPSLAQREALWRQLTATAALLLDKPDRFAESRAVLADAGHAEAVAELDRLAATIKTAAGTAHRTFSPLDVLPPAELPAELAEPLWTATVGGAERFVKAKYQVEMSHLNDQFERGRYLNVVPFVAGGRLFINDGQTVHAIEPSSGRMLWSQRVVEDDMLGGNYIRSGAWLPNGLDMNCVAVSGGRLVAVCGFGAMSTQFPTVESPTSTRLACIDARTGKVLWAKEPLQIANDFEESFWYGRPIISEGRVYVNVRRRQRTQYHDGYVVALDLARGELIWRRHLASVAITTRQVMPAYTHMLLTDGWLYVDSRLGTVARLSALDGAVDWLAVLAVDLPSRPEQPPPPWQASSPILTQAGLLVLDDLAQAVRVIDPETGKMIEKVLAQRWEWPAYLVGLGGGDVLSVGQQLIRFDGASLEPKWRYETGGEELRGRVAVTEDRAYAPIAGALRGIDLQTGALTQTLPFELPANVLVRDGQIIAAQRATRGDPQRDPSPTVVRSYSTWAAASRQLRELATQQGDDPRPLMDLAWLAMRAGRRQAMIESLDAAIQAVAGEQAPAESRKAVFDHLLEMAHQEQEVDPKLRQELFDRMALVTSGPEQEVAHKLVLARFYESQGRIGEAVEQYQLLLADPTYRRQVYKRHDTSRHAGLEARDNLAALLKEHGRAVYEPFELYASERLAQLEGEADPVALIELAESYPLSKAAPGAMLLAATRTAEGGKPFEAIALLRRAELYAVPTGEAADVFAREVELLEEVGEPDRARRVLRFMAAAHPGAPVTRHGEPIDPAAWMALLDSAAEPARATEHIDVPLSDPAAVVPAAIMHPTAQDPIAARPDGFMLRWPDRIELRRPGDLSVVWQRPIDGAGVEVELLSIDKRRVWLWRPQEGRLEVLSAATGELWWEHRELAQVLGSIEVPEPQPMPQPQRPVMRVGVINRQRIMRMQGLQVGVDLVVEREDPGPTGPMFAVSDVAIAMADPQGRVVVLDAENGQVRWQGATLVRKASQMLLDERHVILAGLAGPGEDAEPLACVYDAQTGVLRHRLSQDSQLQKALWLGLNHANQLIQVSYHQVEAFDLARGQRAWACKPGVQLAGGAGVWMHGDRLVVQTKDNDQSTGGDMLWIDMTSGEVTHHEPMRGKLDLPARVLTGPQRWFFVGNDRCVAVNPAGLPQWADAIAAPGRFIGQALTQRYLVLLTAPVEAEMLGTHARRLFLLDPDTGLLKHEHRLESPAQIDSVHVIGGRLMLSGPNVTAVFGAGE